LMSQTVVLTMPGSPKAVELAMDKIIVPELGHLVHEANK
jgi:molybdopterin biosynthesis enzyme MoaB